VTSPQAVEALAALGENLLKQQKYADAEPLLRECLNLCQQKQPGHWSTFHTRSMLGGSLLGQKKHAVAEPLLLVRLTEVLEQLVQLYDTTARNQQAAVWRKQLEVRREADKKPEKPEPK
jgi:hypothetical protein